MGKRTPVEELEREAAAEAVETRLFFLWKVVHKKKRFSGGGLLINLGGRNERRAVQGFAKRSIIAGLRLFKIVQFGLHNSDCSHFVVSAECTKERGEGAARGWSREEWICGRENTHKEAQVYMYGSERFVPRAHKACRGSGFIFNGVARWYYSSWHMPDNASALPVVMAPHWLWCRHMFGLNAEKRTQRHSQEDAFRKATKTPTPTQVGLNVAKSLILITWHARWNVCEILWIYLTYQSGEEPTVSRLERGGAKTWKVTG